LGSAPYDPDTNSCDYFLPIPRPTNSQIEVRAYYLWDAMGRPSGQDLSIWLQAEAELQASFKS